VTRQPLNSKHADEPGHPVAFTDYVDFAQYTIIVALRPAAYRARDTVHEMLTVYEGEPPADDDGDQLGVQR
jgi:hypothetical protein